MNKLKIAFSVDSSNKDKTMHFIIIKIDDMDFIELVKAHEIPFAQKEGNPNIAGGYSYLLAETTSDKLFLGEPSDFYDDHKTTILDCECGCPGCWPLRMAIEIKGATVIWSDFEQPHRLNDKAIYWDYADFGPFQFSLNEYETEISKIQNYS